MARSARFRRTQLVMAKPILEHVSLGLLRRGQDAVGKMMAAPFHEHVTTEEFCVGEIPCAIITPKDEVSQGILLYLHGGGYVCGGLEYAKGFATVLAARLGIRVMTAAYRLAPEHPYPAALEDAMEVYGYLLNSGYDPSRIIFVGESAGGGLAYAICHKLIRKGRTVPAGIIAISPWVDVTASSGSYIDNAKRDTSLSHERVTAFADSYLYGTPFEGKRGLPANPSLDEDVALKQDPLVSPLFGPMDKMPPSLIFVGGDEILLDDAKSLHNKLVKSGVKSELVIAEGMWHAYPLYGVREREGDFDKMARFLRVNIPLTKKLRWMALDNAAKIFPAARRRNWTNLFRLSATLYEEVDLEALKVALDVTVRRFPSIAVRVRSGAFWYYLEELPEAPEIQEEKPYPLVRAPFKEIRKCAFRVIVYGRRIAVEFFHALTDGNGGLIFLNTLVAEYLYQKHGVKVPPCETIWDRLEEPAEEELEDSFLKYAGSHAASRKDTNAYRIVDKRVEDGFKTQTTFTIDADLIYAEAKKMGVTVTTYLTSALMLATARVQAERVKNRRKRKYIKVHVPTNLRKMFPSRTMRNFVMYALPSIDPRLGDYTFPEICEIVHHQIKLQFTKKNMEALIATNVNDERNPLVKAIPLFLKNLVMKAIFDTVGEKRSCFSMSNLGVVKAPKEFTDYVERLDFIIGVQASAPYNTSVVTYGGKLNLSIIRNIEKPILETAFYEVLRELGIPVTVESNARQKE